MCTVDVGVLGQVWCNKHAPHALPDFNTRHTCRDFERVRAWAESHKAPERYPDDYVDRPKLDDEEAMKWVYEDMP